MPELPEVETIKLGLQKYVVGHTIESVEIRKPKIFQGDKALVEGAKIIGVRRFGKGLVIDLSNKYSLAIHIKLTGQLVYRDQAIGNRQQAGRIEVPNTATHIIFKLDKGSLFYNDIRRFGWIKVIKSENLKDLSFFKELGPEMPLVQDSGQARMTEQMFAQILSKSRLAVKPIIMDQKKMSGVGNIYANDALYLAKIDPRRPVNSLSSQEVKDLYKAIITVLKKGLEEGGASELTFVNVLGEKGNYQNHSLIYGHQGKPCKRDGSIIKKFMLGGRGTYMCPMCQK